MSISYKGILGVGKACGLDAAAYGVSANTLGRKIDKVSHGKTVSTPIPVDNFFLSLRSSLWSLKIKRQKQEKKMKKRYEMSK